jgi:hypothetical protein
MAFSSGPLLSCSTLAGRGEAPAGAQAIGPNSGLCVDGFTDPELDQAQCRLASSGLDLVAAVFLSCVERLVGPVYEVSGVRQSWPG